MVPATEVMTVARNLRTLATLFQFTLIIFRKEIRKNYQIIIYSPAEIKEMKESPRTD